jgi:hypothetical protein
VIEYLSFEFSPIAARESFRMGPLHRCPIGKGCSSSRLGSAEGLA